MRALPLLALVVLLAAAPRARAQFATPTRPALHLGGALGPGLGGQVTFLLPFEALLTREATLYADYAPRFTGEGGGRLLVGMGVGAGVRAVRVLTVLADLEAGPYDLDVGFRFGPSFFFSFYEQTAASKARSFALFVEPFVRGSVRLESGHVLYAELGSHPSRLRAGLSLGL